MADVTAVIVTWNSAVEIGGAVASALAEGARVVVIDNNSDDRSVARAIEAGADLVVAAGANLGFGAACNLGLRHVDTRFVLFLNPDASLEPGALAAMTDVLLACPQPAIVGPRTVARSGRQTHSAGPAWTLWTELGNRTFVHRLRSLPSGTRDVGWVSGAALMAGAEVIRRLGGFDDAIFLGYEDLDLCRRARLAGVNVRFTDRATVVHQGGCSKRKALVESLVASQVAAQHYWHKHGGRLATFAVRAMTVPEMGLRAVVSTLLALGPRHRPYLAARLRAYPRIAAVALTASPRPPFPAPGFLADEMSVAAGDT